MRSLIYEKSLVEEKVEEGNKFLVDVEDIKIEIEKNSVVNENFENDVKLEKMEIDENVGMVEVLKVVLLVFLSDFVIIFFNIMVDLV